MTTRPALGCLLAALVLAPAPVLAEFYQWIDSQGRLHTSTVPRAGVREDGTLRPEFDPRSVTHQYPAMLQALRERGEVLEKEAVARAESERAAREASDAAARATVATPVLPDPSVGGSTMTIMDLIELDRRGGRAPPAE